MAAFFTYFNHESPPRRMRRTDRWRQHNAEHYKLSQQGGVARDC